MKDINILNYIQHQPTCYKMQDWQPALAALVDCPNDAEKEQAIQDIHTRMQTCDCGYDTLVKWATQLNNSIKTYQIHDQRANRKGQTIPVTNTVIIHRESNILSDNRKLILNGVEYTDKKKAYEACKQYLITLGVANIPALATSSLSYLGYVAYISNKHHIPVMFKIEDNAEPILFATWYNRWKQTVSNKTRLNHDKES